MCPAASPAGADRATPAARRAGVSRAAAGRIVGLAPSELRRWERLLSDEAGFELGPLLTASDLVALAVMRVVVRRLGARSDAFAVGLARVFQALGERPDLERLDGHAALVGRDFTRIVELRGDHIRCAADDFLVVPLRPILKDFRDQVFA